MRTLPVPATLLPLVLAASIVTAWPQAARAQGTPSPDSIIQALRPVPSGTTRGIHPLDPGVSSAPARAPGRVSGVAPRMAPAQPAAPPSISLTVQFANNSAELTPAAVQTLTALGRALSSPTLAADRFRIEGHTDTVGAPEQNKALSERRADAVVAFLKDRFGIDGTRLEAVGMGEDGLLVQTRPNTPEPRNRRVQVVNLSG